MRSGLVETVHDGAVAVCAPDGSIIASHGDIDTPFFIRSSAKPFQAHVSQSEGAGLSPQELAIAAASHRGHPVQVAVVDEVLAGAGLGPEDLGCPPEWPLSREASLSLARGGATVPLRIWHNCSGKHAGFLRACTARGWRVDTYLNPDHPLQLRVAELLAELGDFDPGPPGVDGCGAPVFRTTARALGSMYARLAADPMLSGVFDAMHQYPALVSEKCAGDAAVSIALNAVAKGGAQGSLGVALAGRFGIGVKSWDGLGEVAVVGAVAALDQMDALSAGQRAALSASGSPPVFGGGRRVGSLQPRLELRPA